MVTINRLNVISKLCLLFLVFTGSVGCNCQPKTPSEPSSDSNTGQDNNGSQAQSLPIPITQDMIDAVAIVPGIQDLLKDLQAGNNVDLNQPVNSKATKSGIPVNDLPLNIMTALGFSGGADAATKANRLKVIESLLSRGADPNPDINTNKGLKPLVFYTIDTKKENIFKLLLKYKGANFNRKDGADTPYVYANRVLVGNAPMHQSFMDAFAAAGINS